LNVINFINIFYYRSRSKKEIVVVNDISESEYLNQTNAIHTEWQVMNLTVILRERNDYVWLEYMLNLKRNHAFYGEVIYFGIYYYDFKNYEVDLFLKLII
jgi:hypothetical protein